MKYVCKSDDQMIQNNWQVELIKLHDMHAMMMELCAELRIKPLVRVRGQAERLMLCALL